MGPPGRNLGRRRVLRDDAAFGDEFGEADVVHGGEELAVRHRYVSRKERRRRRRCMFAGCLVAMKDLREFELARDV